MIGAMKRLFGKADKLPSKLSYTDARDLLEDQSAELRSSLAGQIGRAHV